MLNTPAPTIDFTKLNISLGIDAVPVPLLLASVLPSSLDSSVKAAATSDICNAGNDNDVGA